MTGTTRTVLVAAVLALAVLTGVAVADSATSTTNAMDAQTNETTTNETTTTTNGTNETASVSAPDQKLDGDELTIDSAYLPDGGFAVVYNQSSARIGRTGYLAAGDHENLTVTLNESVEEPQVLVVALVRNNGSETYNASADKVAYQNAQGQDVADVSYVYLQDRGNRTTAETTAEDTETTAEDTATTAEDTETTEATTSSDETADETTEETTEDSSGGTPGFTPATAVVALLAAAFVAMRRN
ncbi:DUF7282 domain-containing protein [Halorussus caseinilyticus]|uniref:PGF-CTERM sorting domain-containing protein n=1 Tax=Halorussus caseinilyticus TaxID=3034025 RepID=A0ABD5WP17_9EURY|nr:PGF-CTERM sorting domain-containing protein [Halorussus sp. DT72]